MHRNRTWQIDPEELRTQRNRILPIEGGDGSTLSLDFTTGVLDPRLSFTRTTNATFINSQGYVQYANANIMRQSENCGSWSGGQNITPTADAAVAPNGTQTADQLNLAATNYRYQVTANTNAVGQPYVASIWMRTVSGTASVGFRIANTTTGSNSAIATCSVTETWQRFNTPAFTLTDTANRTIDAGIDQRSIVSGPNVAANIYVWGLQVQPGTSVGEYLPTTTTEEFDTPRFDYDPTTTPPTPRGLLIEGSASNLFFWSESFATSGAASNWAYNSNTGAIVTSSNPANGTTSFQFAETANSGPLQQSATVTNAVHTFSAWFKASVYNSVTTTQVQFGLYTTAFVAGTASIISGPGSTSVAGNVVTLSGLSETQWTRVQFTTSAAISGGSVAILIYPQTTGFEVNRSFYIWGAQLETGSGASSYIPTGASQGNRAKDVCNITGSNFSSWFVDGPGTIVAQSDNVKFNTRNLLCEFNKDASNYIQMGVGAGAGSGEALFYNPDGFSQSGTTPSLNTAYKSAYVWDTNYFKTCLNGTLGSADTIGNIVSSGMVNLSIGGDLTNPTDVYIKNGHIRSLKYWPTRLPDAQLQALTT